MSKVTREALVDITTKLYRSSTAQELATLHNLTPQKIERLASRLRKSGAKIPKQSKSVPSLIATIKAEYPENFK